MTALTIYVGLTDRDWHEFLSQGPRRDEVNFWQPSGRTQFRALRPGELFLFKLHHPRNFIVGGGIFGHASILPVSLAWEVFGEGNGAPTRAVMARAPEPPQARRRPVHARRHRTTVITDAEKASRDAPSRR